MKVNYTIDSHWWKFKNVTLSFSSLNISYTKSLEGLACNFNKPNKYNHFIVYFSS